MGGSGLTCLCIGEAVSLLDAPGRCARALPGGFLEGLCQVTHGPFFCALAGDAPTGWVVSRERCCGLLYALFLHTPLVPSVEQVLCFISHPRSARQ